jgi:3-isopropylmalate dehydrogenase
MKARIVLLPGDGVGPEVTGAARRVLEHVGDSGGHQFTFEEHPVGGASIDRHGIPLTDRTLEACRSADGIFLGAVGGPRWEGLAPEIRPEQGLLRLRKDLQLYANLRPVKVVHGGFAGSPFKAGHCDGVDIVVVRELTGGIYFGRPRFREQVGGTVRAVDTMEYTDAEITRVVRLAFALASARTGKVTSVDKANVLETSRLWRETATRVAKEFPRVALEHMLVDSAAMRLVTAPRQFDVIVTENMFGDILTDEAGVLVGSLGMLPSASLGDGGPGLYEPVHGSAPDIAGRGIANPVGAILSAAMMLRHSLRLQEEAGMVERAVEQALAGGHATADLGGTLTTAAMTSAILESLETPKGA